MFLLLQLVGIRQDNILILKLTCQLNSVTEADSQINLRHISHA